MHAPTPSVRRRHSSETRRTTCIIPTGRCKKLRRKGWQEGGALFRPRKPFFPDREFRHPARQPPRWRRGTGPDQCPHTTSKRLPRLLYQYAFSLGLIPSPLVTHFQPFASINLRFCVLNEDFFFYPHAASGLDGGIACPNHA